MRKNSPGKLQKPSIHVSPQCSDRAYSLLLQRRTTVSVFHCLTFICSNWQRWTKDVIFHLPTVGWNNRQQTCGSCPSFINPYLLPVQQLVQWKESGGASSFKETISVSVQAARLCFKHTRYPEDVSSRSLQPRSCTSALSESAAGKVWVCNMSAYMLCCSHCALSSFHYAACAQLWLSRTKDVVEVQPS